MGKVLEAAVPGATPFGRDHQARDYRAQQGLRGGCPVLDKLPDIDPFTHGASVTAPLLAELTRRANLASVPRSV
jgi:hypothetical protein